MGVVHAVFVSHAAPLKPAGQLQVVPWPEVEHVPPFWQGFGEQPSSGMSQKGPLQPLSQMQVVVPGAHAP